MQSFESVAEEWNDYRKNPSSCLELFSSFFSKLPKKSLLLDAGCGNGRNSIFLAESGFHVLGVDVSAKMVELSRKNLEAFPHLKNSVLFSREDLRHLDLKRNFNAIFCLAVLHHFDLDEQKMVLKEFSRAVKKNGLLFVSVWNRHQKKFEKAEKEEKVKWKLKTGEVVERYYYFFEEDEICALLEKNGFKVIDKFFEKRGKKTEKSGAQNLCVVAKRI
jgi:2-polyprenyl-3-methyl-5-hydroxy-6-metoxy-1,4-benzoquinol methylase